MKLNNINQETCHHCGAQAVSEYKSEKMHCNGTSEETRRFACGCVLRYSPNFQEVTETEQCEESEIYKKKQSLMLERERKVMMYMKRNLKMTEFEIKELIYDMWRKK